MGRSFALAFFLCFAANTGFSQTGLAGRWRTDRTPDPPAGTNSQRMQDVRLEMTLEGTQASGSLSIGGLGGAFYTFKDGKVESNRIRFQTDPPMSPVLSTIELVDDNTIMLWHERGSLPLVGNNVLELISALAATRQTTPAVQVAAVVPQGGDNAAIRGSVRDQSNATIPGVMVTATNVDSGVVSKTTTDESGRYGFPGLTPGKYTISASLSGFKTSTVDNLNIANTPFQQDFTLEIPATANPSPETCSPSGVVWCIVLHRAK